MRADAIPFGAGPCPGLQLTLLSLQALVLGSFQLVRDNAQTWKGCQPACNAHISAWKVSPDVMMMTAVAHTS